MSLVPGTVCTKQVVAFLRSIEVEESQSSVAKIGRILSVDCDRKVCFFVGRNVNNHVRSLADATSNASGMPN